MENTSPFLFDNIDEKYFLAIKGRAVGPLTSQEVYEGLTNGEASLLHYSCREGWPDWKRLCDERALAVLIPQKPTTASLQHIRGKMAGKAKAAKPIEEERKTYYLYFNSSQYGPSSKTE